MKRTLQSEFQMCDPFPSLRFCMDSPKTWQNVKGNEFKRLTFFVSSFNIWVTLIKSNYWLHANDNNDTITNNSKMINYDGMNS